MKKLILSSVIALAFLASCGNDADKAKSDSLKNADANGGTNVTAVNYQCPMKCEGEKTYATAGKCPMCQMDMKEVK